MRWMLVLLLLVSALAGCRHARRDAAGVVPTVNARRVQRLLEIGTRDLSCPSAMLAAQPVTDRVYRVTGCGNWADYAIFGRHRMAHWRRIVPIADRVAAELSCPAASVTFTPLAPTAYAVAGCGRTGAYDLRCTEIDCGWVATSPPTGAAPAGSSTASVVIIVPATAAPLSVDIEGEIDDEGE